MDDLASTAATPMSLLQTLQGRHAAELVFTRLGTLMVALHPHAPLQQLFSREELQRHLHALGRQMPPHIFELGAPLIFFGDAQLLLACISDSRALHRVWTQARERCRR